MVNKTLAYTGWKKWNPTDEEWNTFCIENKVPFDMQENEYLIVYDNDNIAYYYCYEKGKFRPFKGGSIKTVKENLPDEFIEVEEIRKKKATKKYAKGKQTVIYPRNDEQACAFDLLRDERKTVKLLCGVWGSGKDLLMANSALEALRLGKYEKIIWLRNNVRTKDTPDLGALPGEVWDKLCAYVGPFIDSVGEDSVRTMLQKGTLKVEPLQSIRGRNFANSIIICSEAENLTYDHLKLIVARVAEGSCLFINGDVRQRDLATFEKSQGLEKFIECLKGEPLFGYVYLPKTERSDTARLADKLDTFEFGENR